MDRRAALEAHIDALGEAMESATPGELPALLRERRITLSELAELGADMRGSVVHELAEKRRRRRDAAAKAASPPA